VNKNLDSLSRANATAVAKTKNNLSTDFLRNGGRTMSPSWSATTITDKDMYSDFGYAVITRRANRTAVIGKRNIYTNASKRVLESANHDKTAVVHPYLPLIRESKNFSERVFWYNISTYLDLEGVFYLYAARRVYADGHLGAVQSFSLLNPYNIRKVINSETGELGGYIESRNGKTRDIHKDMIIPISLMDPFNSGGHFSMADAARDAQFTMKQASDYARQAIQGNLNTPGIISTSIELEEEDFANFVSRLQNHNKGEPIFGNGSGTVDWVDMQQDLDKAALGDINKIHLDNLFAIGGVSKTLMGMEESGTGREVSRTQKDDFTENAIMPQIETIIDALNLDYRTHYKDEWEKTHYEMALDNPLESDQDAAKAAVEVRQAEFDVMKALTDAGYGADVASKFARGEIEVTDLGKPEETTADDGNDGDTTGGPNRDDEDVEENGTKEVAYNLNELADDDLVEITVNKVPIRQFLPDLEIEFAHEDNPTAMINSAVKDDTTLITLNGIEAKDGAVSGTTDIFGKFENGYVKLLTVLFDDTEAALKEVTKRYSKQKIAVKN